MARHPARDHARAAGSAGRRAADLGLHRLRPDRGSRSTSATSSRSSGCSGSSASAGGRSPLVGGGTGMIGDPSGRSSERNLLDRDTLEANAGRAARPARAVPGLLARRRRRGHGQQPGLARASCGLIDFLRDTGKHFTIPYMLAKDSVQVRLERGLSFTEFSYMLLQAYDFAHLHRTMGVELQMGGADQWGNITAGLELIRRAGRRRPTGHATRPTPWPTSCCSRRRARSSARARAGSRSGSTRRGPRRTPSTSTG